MDAREELNIIVKIVERAEKLGVGRGTRMTRVMDMQNAHVQFNLRLDEMLAAEDFDFLHDFMGIQANMDRRTGRLKGLFVPRFAGRKE